VEAAPSITVGIAVVSAGLREGSKCEHGRSKYVEYGVAGPPPPDREPQTPPKGISTAPVTARSCGERCLNTDTTGRHQQRWRGPETRSHRTAVVRREEGVHFAQGQVGEHLVPGRDLRHLQLE
jgi:hypothetical protein